MPIYEKPVRLLMQDMAKDLAPEPERVFTRQQALSWFSEHYPLIRSGTVQAHLVRMSTNAPSRIHYNPRPGEDDLFYQLDRGRYRRYLPAQDPLPVGADGEGGDDGEAQEIDEPPVGSSEFAYEADLKNYLARNLELIEPGLTLYEEEEGITGIEFPVGGRFVDLLCVGADGAYVVIELKVSRGYDRVIGQLLRYMAWIKQNLAEPEQQVRGVIVARKINADLIMATSLVENVSMYEYTLSLSVLPASGSNQISKGYAHPKAGR